MKINWSGNLTIQIDGVESSYFLDSVDIEKDTPSNILMKINCKDEKTKVIIPLSRQECKKLVGEFVQSL
jgi:hypothetical protein